MHTIATILLLIVAPALALAIGCKGLEMIEETVFGWVMLAVGVGYPPGAIICRYRRRNRFFRS